MGTRSYRSFDSDIGLSPMNEWMRAIRTPTSYRVGTTSIRLNTMFLAKIGILGLLILTFLVLIIPATSDLDPHSHVNKWKFSEHAYNKTYPLTQPTRNAQGLHYKIAAVADPDTDSKSTTEKSTWYSYLKTGTLTISDDHTKVSLHNGSFNVQWPTLTYYCYLCFPFD